MVTIATSAVSKTESQGSTDLERNVSERTQEPPSDSVPVESICNSENVTSCNQGDSVSVPPSKELHVLPTSSQDSDASFSTCVETMDDTIVNSSDICSSSDEKSEPVKAIGDQISSNNSQGIDVNNSIASQEKHLGSDHDSAVDVESKISDGVDVSNSGDPMETDEEVDSSIKSGQIVSVVKEKNTSSSPSQPQEVSSVSSQDSSIYGTPGFFSHPVDSAPKVDDSCTSPSKALRALVSYGGSSDSDDSMESDNEVQEEVHHSEDVECLENLSNKVVSDVPTTSKATESLNDKPKVSNEDVTVVDSEKVVSDVPTTPKATESLNDKPKVSNEDITVVDLTSFVYRDTVFVDSGTEDSESDSDSDVQTVSSSSSSSSDESSLSDSEGIVPKPKQVPKENKPREETNTKKKKRNPMLTHGEITIDDLPPIEDLKISIPEEQSRAIGFIHSIVERQVVVQGHHGIAPINLESVLFLENGQRPLGKVFDVFGHVQEPLYVVRFNSEDHVKENKIEIGEPVFYAPTTEHTIPVIVSDLMRMKGSDASGLNGNERANSEVSDFSDDEEESRAKGKGNQNKFQSATGEFQSNKKRGRTQGNNDTGDRGGGRGRGRGSNNFNPFSENGGRHRMNNTFNQHPMSQQRFNPRGSFGGPSRARMPYGRDNANYGARSFSHFNGNGHHDMKPNIAGPGSSSQPSHFGAPPQFANHRPGFFSPISAPPPMPPPPQSSFSPGPGQSFGDFQNFPPPSPTSSPCPPYFSPRPAFQDMASPPPIPSYSPQPSPHHSGHNFHNVGPPPSPVHVPSASPRPSHPPPYPPIAPTYPSPDYMNMPPPQPSQANHSMPPPAVHPPPTHPHPPPSHPPPPPGEPIQYTSPPQPLPNQTAPPPFQSMHCPPPARNFRL